MTDLDALTEEVVASFDGAEPRLREVMGALVRHLHSFAREVRLTEEEWAAGVAFLTRAGQISDDTRQELILLSDVLGLSMTTIGINHPAGGAVTESTVFGPFFVSGSPEVPLGGDVAQGAVGEPCWVSGTVRGESGRPVAGARLEVWMADEDGFYDVQLPDGVTRGRAHLFSDDDGGYRFWCVRPRPYPIPHDGPVGDLLAASGRGPMRPAHVHVLVSAPGHRTLTTHVFAAGDPHLGDDAVFGVKDSLVADFTEHPPGEGPDGRVLDGRWHRATFDIVLAEEAP